MRKRAGHRRRLFVACATLLLALAAAYPLSAIACFQIAAGGLSLSLVNGSLRLTTSDPAGFHASVRWNPGEERRIELWFARERWTYYAPYATTSNTTCAVPLWCLCLLAGLATVAARWWSCCAVGMCPECGYSLAGLHAGAPCPECGTQSRRRTADRSKVPSP